MTGDAGPERPGLKGEPIQTPWMLFDGESIWLQIINALFSGNLKWPLIDEEAMKHLGAWSAYTLARLRHTYDSVRDFLRDLERAWPVALSRDAAGDALRTYLAELEKNCQDVDQVTNAIMDKAGSVQYAKMSMIITAYVTIVQVIVSLVLAVLGGVVGSTMMTAAIAIGRTSIGSALGKLLTLLARPVTLALRGLTTMESGLRTLPGMGRLMAKPWGTKLVREVAEEITEEVVIVDGGTKFWQILHGDSRLLDFSQTMKALIGAILGGALGVPFGAVVHRALHPVTALVTAGLYGAMRLARTPNLRLPPAVGGATKWAADGLRMAFPAMVVNGVLSTSVSEFASIVVDYRFNLAAYAGDFSWSRFADGLAGAGLAGAGRAPTQGMLETAHAARSAVDIAVNGPASHEQSFLDAARNDPHLRQQLEAAGLKVNAFTLRQIYDYHGIYDPTDAVYAADHYDDRHSHPGHPIPPPTNYSGNTAGPTSSSVNPAAPASRSTAEPRPASAESGRESAVPPAEFTAESTAELTAESTAESIPESDSSGGNDSGQATPEPAGSTTEVAGDGLDRDPAMGHFEGDLAAAGSLEEAALTAVPPESGQLSAVVSDVHPAVAEYLATMAEGDIAVGETLIDNAGTAGVARVDAIVATIVTLAENVTTIHRERAREISERAERAHDRMIEAVIATREGDRSGHEVDVLSMVQRAEFELLADLAEVADYGPPTTGADRQAAVLMARRDYVAGKEIADQVVQLRARAIDMKESAHARASDAAAPIADGQSRQQALEIQRAAHGAAYESLVAARNNVPLATTGSLPRIVQTAGKTAGLDAATELIAERIRAYVTEQENTEDTGNTDDTEIVNHPDTSTNGRVSAFERAAALEHEAAAVRVELAGIESQLDDYRANLSTVEGTIAELRGTIVLTESAESARTANLIRLALESDPNTSASTSEPGGVDPEARLRHRQLAPELWSWQAEARRLRADIDALDADARVHRRLLADLTTRADSARAEAVPESDRRPTQRRIPKRTKTRQRRYPPTYRPVSSAAEPRTLQASRKRPGTWRAAWWFPGQRAREVRARIRFRHALTDADRAALTEFGRFSEFHQSMMTRLVSLLEPLGIAVGPTAGDLDLSEYGPWVPARAYELLEGVQRLEDRLRRLVVGSDSGRDRGFAILPGLPHAESRSRLVRDGLLTIYRPSADGDAEMRMAYAWSLVERFGRPGSAPRPVLAQLRQALLAGRWPSMRIKPTDESPIVRQHVSWNGYRVPLLESWTDPVFDDVLLVHPVERWRIGRLPLLRFLNPGFTLGLVSREELEGSAHQLAGIELGIDLPSGGVLVDRPTDKTQYLAVVPENVDPQVVIDEVMSELERLVERWPQGMTSAWRHALRDTTPAFAGGLGTLLPFLFAGTSAMFVVFGRLLAAVIRGTVAAVIPYTFSRDSMHSAQATDRARVRLRGIPQRKGAIAESRHQRDRSVDFLRRHGQEVDEPLDYAPVPQPSEREWESMTANVTDAIGDGVPGGLQERLAETVSQELDMSFDQETGEFKVAVLGQGSPKRLSITFTRGWKTYAATRFWKVTTISRTACFEIQLSPNMATASADEQLQQVLDALHSAVDQRAALLTEVPRLSVLLVQEFMTTTPAAVAEFFVAYLLFGPLKAIALAVAAVTAALAAGLQGLLDTFWDSTTSLMALREMQNQQDRADTFEPIKDPLYRHTELVPKTHAAADAIANRARLLAGEEIDPDPSWEATGQALRERALKIFGMPGATVEDDGENGIRIVFSVDSSVGRQEQVESVSVTFHPYDDLRPNVMNARRILAPQVAGERASLTGEHVAQFRIHASDRWTDQNAVDEELTRMWRTIAWLMREVRMREGAEFVKKAIPDVAITGVNMPVLAAENNRLALSSESFRLVEGSLQGAADRYGHRKMFRMTEQWSGTYFQGEDHNEHPTCAELADNISRLDRDVDGSVQSVLDQLTALSAGNSGPVDPAVAERADELRNELASLWSMSHRDIVSGFAALTGPDGPVRNIPGVLEIEPLGDDSYRIMVGRTSSYLRGLIGGNHPVALTIRITSHRLADGVSIWPTSRWGVDAEIGVSAAVAQNGYEGALTELAGLVALWSVLPVGIADLRAFVDNSARVQLGALGNRVGSGMGVGPGLMTSFFQQLPWVAGHTLVHAASARWHTIGLRNITDINKQSWLRHGRFPAYEVLQIASGRYLEIVDTLEKLDESLDLISAATGTTDVPTPQPSDVDGVITDERTAYAHIAEALARGADGTFLLSPGSESPEFPAGGFETRIAVESDGPWMRVGHRRIGGRLFGLALRRGVMAGTIDLFHSGVILTGIDASTPAAAEIAVGLGADVIVRTTTGDWTRITPTGHHQPYTPR